MVRRSQNPFLPQIPSLFFFSPLGRFCLPRLDIGAGLGGAPQQLCRDVSDGPHTFLFASAAVQHERGPRTSTIRKQVALYFRGHKEENGAAAHFPSAALPAPAFFTAVTQLEPHGLELAAVSTTPERQTLVSLAQPTPKVSGLAGPKETRASEWRRGTHPVLLNCDAAQSYWGENSRVLGWSLHGAPASLLCLVQPGVLKLECTVESTSEWLQVCSPDLIPPEISFLQVWGGVQEPAPLGNTHW